MLQVDRRMRSDQDQGHTHTETDRQQVPGSRVDNDDQPVTTDSLYGLYSHATTAADSNYQSINQFIDERAKTHTDIDTTVNYNKTSIPIKTTINSAQTY